MHTEIKNQEIPAGTSSGFYLPRLKEASKPPRFDKIENAVKYAEVNKRSRSIQPMANRTSQVANLDEFIESNKKLAYQRPAIDLKEYA